VRHRVALVAGIVGVALVALLALFLSAGSTADPLANDTNQIVGRPAPRIETIDSEGRPFDLGDYRGRWVLLNFFATWCTPCIKEHPELVAFAEANADNASVVSVAYNDTPEAVSEFFDKYGGDWAVLDDKGDMTLDYAVIGLPESYLVNPSGRVVHKFVGGITRSDVDAQMRRS